MKNLPFSFSDFSQDFFLLFEGNEGVFCEKEWKKFLDTYFSEESELLNQQILEDLQFFKSHDPASQHYFWNQIVSVRRGMLAVLAHRIFHVFLEKFPQNIFEAELLAKKVQAITNVEIHPKAQIGASFAIDHGHGTVIGETTETGKNIFIYHGVTLGATGRKSKNGRRHPRLGNDIFLGNGSQILGPSILENDIHIASEAMILDAYLSSGVTVSPGVTISKVIVPQNTHVFAYDSEKRMYIFRKKGEKEVEKGVFEKWSI